MHPIVTSAQNLSAIARARAQELYEQATARAGRLPRHTLAWGGLALAGLTFLSVNLLGTSALRGYKMDLTQDGLYTISGGTKRALKLIDEPIDVRVYFSRRLGELAPAYARSFERVRTLLEQYRSISGSRLRVAYLDPEAFSDAEDRAVAAGLRGVRLNPEGEQGYFGLAATNSTDQDATIAFFSPDRERFLEYDVTKLIYGLANAKKRVVGLISSIPLDGGLDPVQGMRGQPKPPQMVMEQIREVFEVKTLDKDFKDIPKDVDVLMIVQPDGLSAQAVYAIDQFALGGGKVLVFVDPIAEMGQRGGGMMMGPQPAKLGDFANVLTAWGVGYDPTKVAGDIAHARRVQFAGSGRGGNVTDYVVWLGLDKKSFDPRDVLSASIEKINVASAGFLTKVDGATTTLAPILQTSPQSMKIAAEKISMIPDGVGLIRAYKAEGGALVLAARVTGEAKSAYPDGAPKSEPVKPEGAAPDAAKASEAAKPAEPVKVEAMAHKATGPINVIVIADTDLLFDQFWVDVRDFLGQQVAVPNAQNAAFVVGALENLSGADALISLRGRGATDRPFELVNSIRRDAERRFREKEQTLTEKLKATELQLAKLEKSGDGESVILTDKDRGTIEKFRVEMLTTRRELRDVKLALRQDIDRLDGWLKFLNIAGVPLAICFGGLGFAAWRRRKASA